MLVSGSRDKIQGSHWDKGGPYWVPVCGGNCTAFSQVTIRPTLNLHNCLAWEWIFLTIRSKQFRTSALLHPERDGSMYSTGMPGSSCLFCVGATAIYVQGLLVRGITCAGPYRVLGIESWSIHARKAPYLLDYHCNRHRHFFFFSWSHLKCRDHSCWYMGWVVGERIHTR